MLKLFKEKKPEKIMAVLRREIHSYLFSPGFYAIVIAYLLIPTYLYFRQAFLSSSADLRPLFDALPWALLLFVPALSMKHFTEERKRGSYEALIANPLSEEQLIFGKFMAVFLLTAVASLFFLLIPALNSPFANFDAGKIAAGYAGLILFIAFLASLTLFVSSFSSNQYASFLISAIIILTLYFFSSSFITLALPSWLRSVIEFLAPLNHVQNFNKGVIDISSVLYFAFTTWFFLYGAALRLKQTYVTRARLNREYYLVWLLSVFILLAGLTVANLSTYRFDLTREKLYTLSTATRQVLERLDSKLVIKVYLSKELPPEISDLARDVKGILEEYKRLSRGKIEIIYLQPDVNPRAKIEANNYGLPPIQFNVISNEEYRVKEGYFGIAVLYGGRFDTLPVVTSIGDFELRLTSSIYGLINRNKKKIGIISDAGARNQISGAVYLASLLSKQYEVKEVFASRKDERLENYDALLLLGPSTPLETTTVSRLKKYLQEGGSMFICADMVRVDFRTFAGENTNINVNEITGPYGIVLDNNVLMDLKAYENVAISGEQTYVVPYPFWVRPQPAQNRVASTILGNYRRLVLLWPSSIEIHPTKNVKQYAVLKTSDYAAAQSGFYMLEVNQNFEAYANRVKKYNLAVAAEIRNPKSTSRLFVVGDAEFLDDSLVQQNQENLGFALSAINWVVGENILLGLRQKDIKPAAFAFPSKTVKEGVRYFTLALMVLSVAVFAIVYRQLHLRNLREKYVFEAN
jgi:ABC-type uncharacterized transport system involved in gliding motility auxiliary subunit/ABC-type transport system involved in cytochrome c biogenesis permease component